MKRIASLVFFLASILSPAHSHEAAEPSGVLALTASAVAEVDNDTLAIVFSTTREGSDAGNVQQALKQALEAALTEARKAANPRQVDVRAGNFSIYPRYSDKGKITGWQGTAEMTVEGRDMAAIAQLSGRIATMTVARLGYRLSRELREKTEGEVVAQAVEEFRAKAADYARLFSYGGFSVREVNVQGSEPPRYPQMEMRAKAMSEAADQAPMPVEPGRSMVSVTVSGTVQMK